MGRERLCLPQGSAERSCAHQDIRAWCPHCRARRALLALQGVNTRLWRTLQGLGLEQDCPCSSEGSTRGQLQPDLHPPPELLTTCTHSPRLCSKPCQVPAGDLGVSLPNSLLSTQSHAVL